MSGGPFAIKSVEGVLVGDVIIDPDGAILTITAEPRVPLGRQDLRAIAHRLMNIADQADLRE